MDNSPFDPQKDKIRNLKLKPRIATLYKNEEDTFLK